MGGGVCTVVDIKEDMGSNVEVDVMVVPDETDDGSKVKLDDVEDIETGRSESNN